MQVVGANKGVVTERFQSSPMLVGWSLLPFDMLRDHLGRSSGKRSTTNKGPSGHSSKGKSSNVKEQGLDLGQ